MIVQLSAMDSQVMEKRKLGLEWRHEGKKMTFPCRPAVPAAASNPLPLVGRELHARDHHVHTLQGWFMSERHL